MRILAPLLLLASPLPAHELWLEPLAYTIPANGMLTADIVNGQGFDGLRLPFLSHQAARFDLATPDGVRALAPRMGDRPAADIPAQTAGLHVLAYETKPAKITYENIDKFAEFARYKGAEWAIAQSPQAPLVESYTRHAKTLICVATCQGADRAMGLVTEFVALTPPGPNMRLRLLYQGTPRAKARVTLFEKTAGQTTTRHLTTNAKGEITLPTRPGHSYLADAVVFEPRSGDPAWHTYWAALTFEVPQ